MNTSAGERLPAIIFSWNFQMLNIMKIPWVEKCPWLASVATHYPLNVLSRQTERKETSFMKILHAKHRGRLAGLLQAVIPPKSLVILLGARWGFPPSLTCLRLHRHVLDLGEPACQSPTLELIGMRDSFRWTIRIFFLGRGVKHFTHTSCFTTTH